MQNIVYLDIETIPTQIPAMQQYLMDGVKAPANYKDEEKIAAYIEEAKEDVLNKNSFDGSSNHIITIACAVNDGDPVSVHARQIEDEYQVIEHFYRYLESQFNSHDRVVFVGHNIMAFDLKVIRQRSKIFGLHCDLRIPFNTKPWDDNPYDTMLQWDLKNYIKLDKLALAFGIEQKKLMSGADVYPMWQAGNHDVIEAYCRQDVELVREVYKRMVK
jgi:DNA polymerase elongation subunit (family B)